MGKADEIGERVMRHSFLWLSANASRVEPFITPCAQRFKIRSRLRLQVAYSAARVDDDYSSAGGFSRPGMPSCKKSGQVRGPRVAAEMNATGSFGVRSA